MSRRADWHISGWKAVALAPVLLPVAIGVQLVTRLFGLKNTRDRTISEVASFLRDFSEDAGRAWDWDDFTSVPITNTFLDGIRREPRNIDLPVSDAGRARLKELLEKVEAFARH